MLAALKSLNPQTLRARPSVVFAVLLLAALQFTTATHQFDHTASELGDVCSVCLQLDRLDDVDTADTLATVPLSPDSSVVESGAKVAVVDRHVFAQPRAPPLS